MNTGKKGRGGLMAGLLLPPWLIMMLIRTDECRNALTFLFHPGGYRIFLHRLKFVYRAEPKGTLMAAAVVLLAVIFVISLIRVIAGASLADRHANPEERVIRRYREEKEETRRLNRGSEEQQERYRYKVGKERYLDQLEGFLRDGVVTKEEYRQLKENYERLDDNVR